jgi:tRNA-Thr(GGU) m(6)t(6)A37 methyltransferase TsaA
MEIKLKPVAIVKNTRTTPTDDFWGTVIAEIELADHIPTAAFEHIADFSHLEIIYYFDQVKPGDIVFSGRPRGNPDYPVTGIFAQRKKDRPNTIGLCTVELLEHNGRTIKVKYLDAIDGTPVLDIKPVFNEFQPKTPVKQPAWVADLMKDYWK